MTQPETERLTKVEANQNNMADDITEMKQDIKEIKAILIEANNLYVSKKVVKYFVGLAISLSVLAFVVYDHIHKAIK